MAKKLEEPMRVWVFRTKKSRGGTTIEASGTPVVPSGFVPTRVSALAVWTDQAKRFPEERWTVEGLFGLYVKRYEERFRRNWPFTSTLSQGYLDDLGHLVTRVGMGEAVKAVNAVFSLKWITSEHMGMLRDADRYARFILPELDRRRGGEQAEWTDRANSSGDFFGR